MLTFAEEIMVLLLHDENGAFLPVKGYALNHALAGSVLMDLAFANRIDTDLEQLKVIDREPTGNPMLDRVLGRIADSAETRNTKEWLAAFSAPNEAATIRELALASLVERGILERREEKFLWVFRARRYPMVDGKVEREAKRRIADVLFSDEIPDPRDVALICLADACDILKAVFEGRELKRIRPRIEQLLKMDLIGREMAGAIDDIHLTVISAIAPHY